MTVYNVIWFAAGVVTGGVLVIGALAVFCIYLNRLIDKYEDDIDGDMK